MAFQQISIPWRGGGQGGHGNGCPAVAIDKKCKFLNKYYDTRHGIIPLSKLSQGTQSVTVPPLLLERIALDFCCNAFTDELCTLNASLTRQRISVIIILPFVNFTQLRLIVL